MVNSMTAFARHTESGAQGQLTWELRSVNHRYLEPHFRIPDNFRELEPALRELLKKHLGRGKVECSLKVQGEQNETAIQLNPTRLEELQQALQQVAGIATNARPASQLELLAWPGVLDTTPADNKSLLKTAMTGFEACVKQIQNSRAREGSSLAELITQRLDTMSELVEQVEAHLPDALAAQRQQLQTRLGDLLSEESGANPDRLEQEMVMLAQKADVAEELDRLKTHINEVKDILTRNEPIGRRLDFMMQELNREANTLSSKALTTETTRSAVDLKVLIEQMREQVQNIE